MSVTVVYRSAADLNRAEYWYEEGPKLQIEVEKLRKVANAAKMVCALCPVSDTCIPDDCWVWPIKVALKEGE